MCRAYCDLARILTMAVKFKTSPFLGRTREMFARKINPTTMMLSSFNPPPSSKNRVQEKISSVLRGWSSASGCSLSLKRRLSTRYPAVFAGKKPTAAPQRQKNNQSQLVSPAPPSPPFFLSFHSFPHSLTISPPHHALPTLLPLSLSLSFCLSFPVLGHRALVHG